MTVQRQHDNWETSSEVGPCICSQLRRTARKVSAVYDKALAATGLTVTQHALLVNIARAEKIGPSSLAAQLGMDRTTLTRNLNPLTKLKLVVPAESVDRRQRLFRVSSEGRRKLRQSYVLWENAQKELAASLGLAAVEQLREALRNAEAAAVASADEG